MLQDAEKILEDIGMTALTTYIGKDVERYCK